MAADCKRVLRIELCPPQSVSYLTEFEVAGATCWRSPVGLKEKPNGMERALEVLTESQSDCNTADGQRRGRPARFERRTRSIMSVPTVNGPSRVAEDSKLQMPSSIKSSRWI